MNDDIIHAEGVRLAFHHPPGRVRCSVSKVRSMQGAKTNQLARARGQAAAGITQRQKASCPLASRTSLQVVLGPFSGAK